MHWKLMLLLSPQTSPLLTHGRTPARTLLLAPAIQVLLAWHYSPSQPPQGLAWLTNHSFSCTSGVPYFLYSAQVEIKRCKAVHRKSQILIYSCYFRETGQDRSMPKFWSWSLNSLFFLNRTLHMCKVSFQVETWQQIRPKKARSAQFMNNGGSFHFRNSALRCNWVTLPEVSTPRGYRGRKVTWTRT